MKERAIIPTSVPQESFKSFLVSDRHNRFFLRIAAVCIVIQLIVFKYFYPYASYIHGDSFIYLDIARENLDIESYLVGYARFLRLFSVFSTSDTALVVVQYLSIQGSALLFLFTLFYFYRPGRITQAILFFLITFNPLFLYLANMISSDGLFLSLSLIWFTILLWIIHNPSIYMIIWHAFILFIAFTVRYNALIYPAIAVSVLLLSRLSFYSKLVGVASAILLCSLFVLYTGSKYKALTGIWQYSPFGGWLIANNAMYAYRYVDSAQRKAVPKRFEMLDNMIRNHFDSTRDVKKYPQEALLASTVYMWSPSLPLYKFRDRMFQNDTIATELKKWASMGPFYKAYGMYIIKQYPAYYAKYFLLPNSLKYYAPPTEFLGVYNSGYSYVDPIAQKWFRYDSANVTTRVGGYGVRLLEFYPIYSGVINVVMFFGLLCFAMLNGFRKDMLFRKGILLAASVWVLNAGFTIAASSAALRFQSFPIILTGTFAFLLLDWISKIGMIEKRPVHLDDNAKNSYDPVVEDAIPDQFIS